MKADKGEKTVIMDMKEYIRKSEILLDDHTTYQRMKSGNQKEL